MKKYALGFIVGIIFSLATVCAANMFISSNEISYESEYTEKNNVADAIDELFTTTETLNNGTATSADILSGKTAVVGKELLTGTMANKGAWTGSSTRTSNGSSNVTIPAGYHNGSGYVTCTSNISQATSLNKNSKITVNMTAKYISKSFSFDLEFVNNRWQTDVDSGTNLTNSYPQVYLVGLKEIINSSTNEQIGIIMRINSKYGSHGSVTYNYYLLLGPDGVWRSGVPLGGGLYSKYGVEEGDNTSNPGVLSLTIDSINTV